MPSNKRRRKKKVKKEYLRRRSKQLKIKVYRRNLIKERNILAVTHIRYSDRY